MFFFAAHRLCQTLNRQDSAPWPDIDRRIHRIWIHEQNVFGVDDPPPKKKMGMLLVAAKKRDATDKDEVLTYKNAGTAQVDKSRSANLQKSSVQREPTKLQDLRIG